MIWRHGGRLYETADKTAHVEFLQTVSRKLDHFARSRCHLVRTCSLVFALRLRFNRVANCFGENNYLGSFADAITYGVARFTFCRAGILKLFAE